MGWRPIRTSEKLDIAEGSRERLPRRFRDCDAPASNRLGQCGKPDYQSCFEPTTGTLETFVTLAAI